VHALRGASASAGARGMQEIAHLLEQMGTRGEFAPALEAFEGLQSEFEQAHDFLQDYMNARTREILSPPYSS